MRRELRQHGIDLVMVQCGAVKTAGLSGTTRDLERVDQDGPREPVQRYGAMVTTARDHTARVNRLAVDPSAVAKVIGRALTVRRPRIRYLVGPNAIIVATMAKVLPDRVIDLLVQSLVKPG